MLDVIGILILCTCARWKGKGRVHRVTLSDRRGVEQNLLSVLKEKKADLQHKNTWRFKLRKRNR